MTKEWQEATNEYLKVRIGARALARSELSQVLSLFLTRFLPTEPKLRPPHWYLVRGLLWQGPRPVALWQALIQYTEFSFVTIERDPFCLVRNYPSCVSRVWGGKIGDDYGCSSTYWTGGERCKYRATQTIQRHFFFFVDETKSLPWDLVCPPLYGPLVLPDFSAMVNLTTSPSTHRKKTLHKN